jgi:hypothetical protein
MEGLARLTLSFLVRWAVTVAPPGLVTVAFQEGAPHAASLRPPLESLLAARTVSIDVPDGSPESLRSARGAGAAYLVTTDTVGGESGTLTMTLYDAASEERLLVRYGGGPNETVAAAAGRLALELVRSLAELEDRSLTFDPQVTLQTESPIALFHLMEGQRRFAMAQFDAAAASFRRSIEADSGFVPAYYYVALAEQWRWAYAEGWDVLDLALRRGVSSPAWRRLVEAQRHYLERDAAAALDGYQLVTLHHPELREGWLGLGEALYHYGGFLGHAPADAARPLQRALERDSLFAPVAHHLVELALWRSAPDSAGRALTWTTRDHPVRPVEDAALAIENGSDDERASAWRVVSEWDLRLLSLLVAHFGFHPGGKELATRQPACSHGRTASPRSGYGVHSTVSCWRPTTRPGWRRWRCGARCGHRSRSILGRSTPTTRGVACRRWRRCSSGPRNSTQRGTSRTSISP